MKKLILGLLATLLLAGCGGDDTLTGSASSSSSSSSSSSVTNTVASVTMLASSPQLPSDNSAPVTLTAYVLNAANQTMEGQTVIFQIASGGGYLSGISSVTNANGVATATLNTLSDDPANRTIRVNSTVGTLSDSVDVNVVGTKLTITGSSAVVFGASAIYTATLTNYGDDPIAGKTVTLSSSTGNSLSTTSAVTNSNGQVAVTMTGTVGGAGNIVASSLGLTAQQAVTVTTDSFAFLTPAANTEIALSQNATATVQWTIGGTAQQNETISFSTTRGTLSASSATTGSNGQASVTISSTNAGPAVISATTDTGATTQVNIEFVATTPASINVQASPNTIATSEQSTITAVVRDTNGNLVKNKIVEFTLNDVTGGTLSSGAATTDSQGRAQTVYTASTTTSAANGVSITAAVQLTSVTSATTLTVAARGLFISLGTGNEISEPNTAQYSVEYAIQVTDANGNGVADTPLTVRVVSLWYGTGERDWNGSKHEAMYVEQCLDEDSLLGAGDSGYRNGILNVDEDFNNTGRLEAGNIATVTPNSVTTDENGFALINVVYPQEYADWVKVQLSASTTVQGSESVRSVSFVLPAAAEDVNVENTAPPGPTSPFGIASYGCPAPGI